MQRGPSTSDQTRHMRGALNAFGLWLWAFGAAGAQLRAHRLRRLCSPPPRLLPARQVFVLCGGNARARAMVDELRLLRLLCARGQLPATLVVLTDPDREGRQLRLLLDDALWQLLQQQQQQQQQQQGPRPLQRVVVLHAFLSVDLATSTGDSR